MKTAQRKNAAAQTAAGLLLALALAGPAAAGDGTDHDRAKALRDEGRILPLETILERARKIQAGRVVGTELEEKSAGYVYEIQIADEHGTLWELKFDAADGTLIKSEKER
jgi:uncharacterized membrane protein YkoI